MAIQAYSDNFGPQNKQYWGDGPPTLSTDGTYQKGDIIWNTAPAAAGPSYWSCVTAGTPGTWKAGANIAA